MPVHLRSLCNGDVMPVQWQLRRKRTGLAKCTMVTGSQRLHHGFNCWFVNPVLASQFWYEPKPALSQPSTAPGTAQQRMLASLQEGFDLALVFGLAPEQIAGRSWA
jgi:hypothetical protein